jgi:uncharacterized membrane protein
VLELIHADDPSFSEKEWICVDDLARYLHRYVESLLSTEKGEIDELQHEVLRSLRDQDVLSRNPEDEYRSELSPGERLADRVAALGGSWTFIGIFTGVLILWIALNSTLATRAFDPFPYILLNLVLLLASLAHHDHRRLKGGDAG